MQKRKYMLRLMVVGLVGVLTNQNQMLLGEENKDGTTEQDTGEKTIREIVVPNAEEDILEAAREHFARFVTAEEVKYTLDCVSGDSAFVKITPEREVAALSGWVYCRRNNGLWTGLIFKRYWSPNDYEDWGVPTNLREEKK
jgi:hypothetical protein